MILLTERQQFLIENFRLGILNFFNGQSRLKPAVGPVGQRLHPVNIGALRAEGHAHCELHRVFNFPAGIFFADLFEQKGADLPLAFAFQQVERKVDVKFVSSPGSQTLADKIFAEEISQPGSVLLSHQLTGRFNESLFDFFGGHLAQFGN